MPDPGVNLERIASGLRSGSHGDLFFGDGDVDQQVLDYEQEILQDSQVSTPSIHRHVAW